jgi:hypothetical protein
MLKIESDILTNVVAEAEEQSSVTSCGIGEILASAQWKHALFTTYALSLSYFESEVLRPRGP